MDLSWEMFMKKKTLFLCSELKYSRKKSKVEWILYDSYSRNWGCGPVKSDWLRNWVSRRGRRVGVWYDMNVDISKFVMLPPLRINFLQCFGSNSLQSKSHIERTSTLLVYPSYSCRTLEHTFKNPFSPLVRAHYLNDPLRIVSVELLLEKKNSFSCCDIAEWMQTTHQSG